MEAQRSAFVARRRPTKRGELLLMSRRLFDGRVPLMLPSIRVLMGGEDRFWVFASKTHGGAKKWLRPWVKDPAKQLVHPGKVDWVPKGDPQTHRCLSRGLFLLGLLRDSMEADCTLYFPWEVAEAWPFEGFCGALRQGDVTHLVFHAREGWDREVKGPDPRAEDLVQKFLQVTYHSIDFLVIHAILREELTNLKSFDAGPWERLRQVGSSPAHGVQGFLYTHVYPGPGTLRPELSWGMAWDGEEGTREMDYRLLSEGGLQGRIREGLDLILNKVRV